jgi:hypothetical protein
MLRLDQLSCKASGLTTFNSLEEEMEQALTCSFLPVIQIEHLLGQISMPLNCHLEEHWKFLSSN